MKTALRIVLVLTLLPVVLALSGMALSEIGQHDAARPKIERSLAQVRRNAYGAHAEARGTMADLRSLARCA